jgi:hypothetical protein
MANDGVAKVAALREREGPALEGGKQVTNRGLGTKKDQAKNPVLSVTCDGTASPDRTGDLQSHNLAL